MKRTASQSVSLMDETINQMLDAKMKEVNLLSQEVSLGSIGSRQGAEDPRVRQKLDAYQQNHPELELTFVGTDQGVYMNAPSSVTNPPDYDPRVRPWYKQAMDNKDKVIITDPYISKASNNVVVTIAKVVNDGHGVMAINLSLKALGDVVKGVKIGNDGYLYLLDAKSKYLSHPTKQTGSDAKGPQYENMYRSNSGIFNYVLDGNPKKMAFTTNRLTGWKLAGTWYSNEVSQEAAPIFNKTVLVIAVALALGTIIVFFYYSFHYIPAASFNRNVPKKISLGDLGNRVDVNSKDEFGEVAASFNNMIDSLRTVLTAVSESSNQLAASAEELSVSADHTSKATEHIAASIEQMAVGANQQVDSVQESARTINDVSARIQQIVANSQSVADATIKTSEKIIGRRPGDPDCKRTNEFYQRLCQRTCSGCEPVGRYLPGDWPNY